MVALVLPLRSGIHVPVVMQFAASVVTSAREHDHDVLLLTEQEGEEGLRRVAASSMVDGVLVMDVQMHDERLPALRSLDRPAVLIGMPEDTTGLTCVDLDFTAAGAACVGHLADLGHRQVALIGSPPEVYARETGFAERVERGFHEAARQRGMGSSAHPCAPTAEAVEELLDELLHDHPDLTSLVVHNEPLVEPAIRAAAAGRPGGAGPGLGGGHLPRRGGRAGPAPGHLGADPLRGARPPCGRPADDAPRRRHRPRDDPAHARADRPRQHRPAPPDPEESAAPPPLVSTLGSASTRTPR